MTKTQIAAHEVLMNAQRINDKLYIDLHGVIREAATLLWEMGAFEGESTPFGFILTDKGEALRMLVDCGMTDTND